MRQATCIQFHALLPTDPGYSFDTDKDNMADQT